MGHQSGWADYQHSRGTVSGGRHPQLWGASRDRQGRHGCGAAYLNGIGGAAQYYARAIEKVLGVHLMDFGIPEAMWHLRVNDFVAIVTMDANGNSLHAKVEAESGAALEALQNA